MTDVNFAILIDFAAGGLTLAAVLVVWRRELRAIVRLLGVAGRGAGGDVRSCVDFTTTTRACGGRCDGAGAAGRGSAMAAGRALAAERQTSARPAAGEHRPPLC